MGIYIAGLMLANTASENMVGLSGGVFDGICNLAGIVTSIVIGYVVASTGSFTDALWGVAARGVSGILAYLLLA